jgi:hypothetical protein
MTFEWTFESVTLHLLVAALGYLTCEVAARILYWR